MCQQSLSSAGSPLAPLPLHQPRIGHVARTGSLPVTPSWPASEGLASAGNRTLRPWDVYSCRGTKKKKKKKTQNPCGPLSDSYQTVKVESKNGAALLCVLTSSTVHLEANWPLKILKQGCKRLQLSPLPAGNAVAGQNRLWWRERGLNKVEEGLQGAVFGRLLGGVGIFKLSTEIVEGKTIALRSPVKRMSH